jgi:hypothetical protein
LFRDIGIYGGLLINDGMDDGYKIASKNWIIMMNIINKIMSTKKIILVVDNRIELPHNEYPNTNETKNILKDSGYNGTYTL